ncbi:hypothetical protein HUT06_09175 [Actinomadura sp. NAK00032]|uniref:hypothetical protein n=1 Tax=Actinomadura sp. NAK00032 TaxID=2742128 RepID=UPI0015903790|nr:hypothetical protein [Actinomadura sp. NAK00032]QKW34173.1 hypothetical protein HUT06_09175 [Actinomadura sp. NAK00032]
MRTTGGRLRRSRTVHPLPAVATAWGRTGRATIAGDTATPPPSDATTRSDDAAPTGDGSTTADAGVDVGRKPATRTSGTGADRVGAPPGGGPAAVCAPADSDGGTGGTGGTGGAGGA